MSTKRTGTWLAFILGGIALLLAAIPGLWVYMKVTAKPLHPNSKDVPSVRLSEPMPKWAAAANKGRELVHATLTDKSLPGVSVAVGIGGDIVWAEGFGFANLENRVPVTPNHRFRIGTASKALTSAAAGLLIEQDRLKLDEAIQTYVPAFPQKQWPVTLRQLMGHLGGVRNDGGDEGPLLAERCEQPVQALPHFANTSLLFQPGTQYHYSSYGWILVSAAVETAAGKPFLNFMREQIFAPLAMRDTIADSAEKPAPEQVTSYFPKFAADPTYGLHLMRGIDYSCYAGASVFLSTPSDLVRFGIAINNGKLLRPATVQLLQTSLRLPSGEETGYGLGWDLETATLAGQKARIVGHDGDSLGGMVASLLTFPDHGMVVAVTSNISYSDTYSLAVTLAQAFADHRK
jgi:serine beta-lactamase-like protein LACTB